jgi:hypothetical protein
VNRVDTTFFLECVDSLKNERRCLTLALKSLVNANSEYKFDSLSQLTKRCIAVNNIQIALNRRISLFYPGNSVRHQIL